MLCKAAPTNPVPGASHQPHPPVPGTVKARPTGQLEAEGLLQVGTAIVVHNLPEMQAAIIQQGQEATLVGEQRPSWAGGDWEGDLGAKS